MTWRLWLSVLSVVSALSLLKVSSHFFVNTGMLAYRDAVWGLIDPTTDTYPTNKQVDITIQTNHMLRYLQQAVELDPTNSTARWAVGRALARTGDSATASQVLSESSAAFMNNPLFIADAVSVLSTAEKPTSIVNLYESIPRPELTEIISDTVALAYLDLITSTGDDQDTTQWLEKVRQLRPDDLYANYRLWEAANASGSDSIAQMYSDSLSRFSKSAVVPSKPRLLLEYALTVVPLLRQKGLWDQNKTANMAAYLVWKYSESTVVEAMLEQMATLWPAEGDWPFFLGELYHRRGDWERSREAYLRAVSLNPVSPAVYFRLGMIEEASCESQKEPCKGIETAYDWYEQYFLMAPNDIWVSSKTAELSERLGKLDIAASTNANSSNDRSDAAKLLGVPETSLQLGPNLVQNGDFQTWAGANPAGWQLGTYAGTNEDHGVYIAGKDMLSPSGNAGRVLSLWGGATPDGAVTYSEYFSTIPITVTNAHYLVTVEYKQRASDEVDLLLIGDMSQSGGHTLVKSGLTDTDDQWLRKTMLVEGVPTSTGMTLLVRNWGQGQLWINEITVREVLTSSTKGLDQ